MRDVVQRIFAGMGRSKVTPLCPYIFHMYHMYKVLLPSEKKEYWIAEALLKHNVELEKEEAPEASEDSDRKSLNSKEIQEIQRQEFTRMKKSPRNKRGSPAVKDLVERRRTPTLLDAMELNYQAIANNLKDIRDREHGQGELIRAMCKKLENIKPDELEAAINNLPTQKRMDELEAKNSFLLEKTSKLRGDLKETRKDHHEAVDKLNAALQFNQKLEEYVGNPGDVVNKVRLFDENLARNPVSASKVMPILVDIAEKMEELFDEMKVMFEGLQLEVPLVAVENLSDISGEIPSLTGWGQETAPTKTPTKPDQSGPSKPTREEEEEEVPPQLEYKSPPRKRVAEPIMIRREVPVNTVVEEVVRELEEERSQANKVEILQRPARIDVIQTRPEEPIAERMWELPTPLEVSTPEPLAIFTPKPLQTPRPTFIGELERVTTPHQFKSPFKTPSNVPSRRFPFLVPTPKSTGLDTRRELEPSGSGRSSRGGADVTETSSRVARVTRFAAKRTPRGPTSLLPKVPILSPTKGPSSKRPKK